MKIGWHFHLGECPVKTRKNLELYKKFMGHTLWINVFFPQFLFYWELYMKDSSTYSFDVFFVLFFTFLESVFAIKNIIQFISYIRMSWARCSEKEYYSLLRMHGWVDDAVGNDNLFRWTSIQTLLIAVTETVRKERRLSYEIFINANYKFLLMKWWKEVYSGMPEHALLIVKRHRT